MQTRSSSRDSKLLETRGTSIASALPQLHVESIIRSAREQTKHDINQYRHDQYDRRQGTSEWPVQELAYLGLDDVGDHDHAAAAEQSGRHEGAERQDEHERTTREQAGQGQRQIDPPEDGGGAGTKAFGG